MTRSMRSGAHALIAFAVTTTVVAAPAPAEAQNKLQQAREHFDRGTAFFRQGKFEEALKELMEAYVLDPNPLLVYNIARVHQERGDPANALKFFKNYLTIAPRARNRRKVKQSIRALKRALKNRPKEGMISITSDPVGATVRLSGKLLGQTPLNGKRVSTGRHKLEVLRDRYKTYHADVIVQTGRTTTLSLRLIDQPSSVLITTTPPSATATLIAPNTQPLGTCPCVVNLSSGRYKLRVSLRGFRTREFDFVKQPLEQLKVPVSLVPLQTSGQLMVDSSVRGAQVRVDGQPLGTTPLARPLDIRLGTVQVEVTAPGHQTWRQPITVGPNGITQVRAVLQPIPHAVGFRPHPPPVVYKQPEGGARPQSGWGWTLTGIGIASVVGGGLCTTFALLDQRKFDNATYFKVNKPPKASELIRQDLTQGEALALEEEAHLLQTISIAAYATGGAMLLTGIILVATDSPPPPVMNSMSVVPIPGGALMSMGASF